jgi:hypothetical protein
METTVATSVVEFSPLQAGHYREIFSCAIFWLLNTPCITGAAITREMNFEQYCLYQ